MPGRHFASEGYRYGFNEKENDNETVGTGEGTQDYGMRIYNPSLGKFLSVDPLTSKYPFQSPFSFAENTPIWAIDLDGGETKFKPTEQATRAVQALYSSAQTLNVLGKKTDSYFLQITAGGATWFANGLASMVVMGGQNNPQPTNSAIPPCGGVAPYSQQQKQQNTVKPASTEDDPMMVKQDAELFKNGDIAQKTEALFNVGNKAAAVFGFPEENVGLPPRNMTYWKGSTTSTTNVFSFSPAEISEFITTEEQAQNISNVKMFADWLESGNSAFYKQPIYITEYKGQTYVLDGHNRLHSGIKANKSVNAIKLSNQEAKEMFKSKMEEIEKGWFDKKMKDDLPN